MERATSLLATGAIGVVIGLWTTYFYDPHAAIWMLGAALAAFGGGTLLAGIAYQFL
ncbi:hypothetical protein [Salinadaptatus halalkaliphilus]|uniref:hypothetical protein n=1 Tax=Salinadaptatus halalkaliphilus TaxID=2419781 RepID=UPI0015810BD8|nr:hypothetical protein [Salinadaptatus halalkaliphilus]